MKKINFWIGVTIAWIASACSAPLLPPGQVKVEQGIVQGTMEDGIRVFKGIPFAAPPVGDLRWKAPQAPMEWEGVKATTEYGPSAYQGGDPPSGKSEDCLYLNVWTPAQSADEKVPVLVWIYGGGFSFGSTAEPVYTGEKLAEKGVVFVSIAYRVNQLGFLAQPELSAENPNHVSGNYGLLDMIAGLEWVQKNIAEFGGDPDKVTIFGESAGGIAVSMLCASPLAKGLFHGAISQSGGSFGPSRSTTYPGENMKLLADAEKDGIAYMEKAGVTSLEELRALPVDSLPIGFGMGSGWPIVDGYVIPDDQYKLYEDGQFNDTPILVGYNSDEGASFTRTEDPEAFMASVKLRYGKFADELLKAYPVGDTSVPKTARDLARDAAFGWHTWSWARLHAQKGSSSAYYYYFDQHPDYPEDSPRYGQGSPHGQDVAYVFMHLDPENPQTSESDLLLSEAIGTYWTNFARYGHPNGEGVPEWPAFSDENPKVMYLTGPEPFVGPVPSAESLEVLDGYFQWRRSGEVNSRVVEDGGTGPFSALMVSDESLSTHTIFRPQDLSVFGKDHKLPIIAWGNGACADSPWEHVNFLNEVASHGFLVIAIGPMPEEGEQSRDRSVSSKLSDAIDWAIAQNGDPDSPYFDRIDVKNVAVSGMSCGGLQTLEIAPDPRVTTVVVCNSGILPSPDTGMPGMPGLSKDQLKKLHTPALYILGGESDIAYNNGMDDYKRIEHVPVFMANMDVGHGGTYQEPHGGEFAKVATAWYLWQMKGDMEASKMFLGDDCVLCTDPNWKFESKNL